MTLGQIQGWIGEINRAVGPKNHIVRAIELLPVKFVRQSGVFTVRRDGNDAIKKAMKDKKITEDDEKRAMDEIQKLTDDEIKKMEEMSKAKEKEVMELK